MSKIIVSLSEELLGVVDEYCKKFKYNRSEFVRHALREVLKENDNTVEDKKVS